MDLKNEKARQCIDTHVKQAMAVTLIPLVSTPIVWGVCAKMIARLDKIYGIPTAKGWDSEILHDILAGVVAAPALAIPLLGAVAASAYIKSVGGNYARAVEAVLDVVSQEERNDGALISQRVREELQRSSAEKREKRRKRLG
jgi:uncharacterized protein (DUF697 family)